MNNSELGSIVFAGEKDPRDCSAEVWTPVPKFEANYMVSNWGRVIRIARGSGTRMKKDELFRLKSTPGDNKGYPLVNLYKDGKRRTVRIHRLVLETFVGTPPEDKFGEFQAHHKDGKITNNRLDNLEWTTSEENRLEQWQRYLSTGVWTGQ